MPLLPRAWPFIAAVVLRIKQKATIFVALFFDEKRRYLIQTADDGEKAVVAPLNVTSPVATTNSVI